MRFLFQFFLFPFFLIAQNQNYSFSEIDGALLKNADAVVRLNESKVTITAQNSMEVTLNRVVTVLNKKGEQHINAYTFYDNNSKIKSLKATILNASGSEIQVLKERDFLDQSASGSGTLYSDSRVKFMRYTPVGYPYTVIFESTYTTMDTAFVPNANLLDGYRVSVEKSQFCYNIQCDINYRVKEINLDKFGIVSEKTDKRLLYTVSNLIAIESEAYAPLLVDFAPIVKLALDKFHLKGIDGEATSWNDYGKWIYDSLLFGRDELDVATIRKIGQLVAGIEDPKQKVQKVYEFVQDNTRYISVQLGIGGWMPITAKEVDKVKYGDCKGLANYTKALLKAVGVKSFYTVVYADSKKRDLDSDFPSLQGNHVFLNVPLQDEEIWLECTNQEVPVNYLGTFTDDRYVLKVTSKGGELIKTKKYRPQDSKQLTKATITITEEETINAVVEIQSTGIQYDQKYRLPLQDSEDHEEHYKDYWDYVNNIDLVEVEFENDKESIVLKERVKLKSRNYLSKAGDRVLFAPNMLNRNLYVPKRTRNRKRQIFIKRGYLDEDEFTIEIPESLKVETLISASSVKNAFGEYSISIEQVGENKLLYKRKLLMKSGKYPKEEYTTFRDFRKKIAKSDNAKIVLIKTK